MEQDVDMKLQPDNLTAIHKLFGLSQVQNNQII